MKRIFFSAFLILTSLCAQEFKLKDIAGIWEIPEEIEGQVSIGEIFIEDGKAFVYAFEYAKKVDGELVLRDTKSENSDAMKMKNTIFLANLELNGDEFTNGRIYRPSNGSTYYVSARLSEDKKTLFVRVSVDRFGLLGVTLSWSKIPDGIYKPLSREEIKMIDALASNKEE